MDPFLIDLRGTPEFVTAFGLPATQVNDEPIENYDSPTDHAR